MNLLALGISHHSASVDVRERVAFAPEQVAQALTDACAAGHVEELVILSTCNRTELYAVVPDGAPLQAQAQGLIEWVAGYHHLGGEALHRSAYCHEGDEALRHLVRVASGLDSMVLGEPQIFGQLKSAYAVAVEAGSVNDQLGRLFPRAFAIAKRVRTDTAIGENPVSVAYAAVDLAGHIFSDLGNCRALLVGAGETVELVTRHLIEAGVGGIVIGNRTLDRARDLAQQFGAEAILLSEVPEQLPRADIVITSTASQLPILGKGAVEQAVKARKHRPMLMVDLAVPRDIEAQVGELRDVYLYCVDDLKDIVDENLRGRRSEASKADVLIDEGVQSYLQELRSLDAVDAVKAYRNQAEGLRQSELQRAQRALARGEDVAAVLDRLSRAITNKLIHAPTAGLKRASVDGQTEFLQRACELLGVEPGSVDTTRASISEQEPDNIKAAGGSSGEDSPGQGELDLPPGTVLTDRRTLQ